MRRPMIILLVGLAACHADWQAEAVNDAEDLVREQMKNPSLQFSGVQFTGDEHSGQTCGYFETTYANGWQAKIRFIAFIDGAGGQNPYIDDPSAPYPVNKHDFALNWRTQCVELGYSG